MDTRPQFENQKLTPERDAISPDVGNTKTALHVEHQALSTETVLTRIDEIHTAIINEVFDRR